MTAENILQSDVLDILFEGRNKLYGAYELRRTYNRRMKRAVGGMLLLITLGTAGYLFGSGRNHHENDVLEIKDPTVLVSIIEPPKPKEAVKPPSVVVPKDVAMVKNTIPIITKDVPKTEVPEVKQIDTSVIGNKTQDGIASGIEHVATSDPGVTGGTPGESSSGPATTEPSMPTGPIDMGMADEMPAYPGGTQALVRYMVNNLTSELEPGVKYVLKAQFVINEQGNVSEATILSSDDQSLNQQVLKAIKKMKTWKPGKLRGHNVAVRFTMPVTFVGAED